MRSWLWRTLACAGNAFAGCGVPSDFVSVDTRPSVTDADLFPSPKADPSDTPIRCSRRQRVRNRSEIVGECEAFLAGRYDESVIAKYRQLLPAWAWVNPLAHAGYSDLKRLADLSPNRDDPLGFLSYLADEVLLRTGGDDQALRRMQHDALVPLELALLRQPNAIDLTELARIIRDLLEYRTGGSASRPSQPGRCSGRRPRDRSSQSASSIHDKEK